MFCRSDEIYLTVTHHHSDSIVHQGGRSIETGGVFTDVQSGPKTKGEKQNKLTVGSLHQQHIIQLRNVTKCTTDVVCHITDSERTGTFRVLGHPPFVSETFAITDQPLKVLFALYSRSRCEDKKQK